MQSSPPAKRVKVEQEVKPVLFRLGAKEVELTNSLEQNSKLNAALDLWGENLKAQKTSSTKHVVRGEWNRETRLAFIEKPKGKHFNSFGRRVGPSVELCPEEALYLVDQAVLELYEDNLPLSVAECWSLLGNEIPMPQYLAYTHLLRLGYTVKRWSPERVYPPLKSKPPPEVVKGVHAPTKKSFESRAWWSEEESSPATVSVPAKDLLWIKRLPRLGPSTVGRNDADTLLNLGKRRQKKKRFTRTLNSPDCLVPLRLAQCTLFAEHSDLRIHFDVFRPGQWKSSSPPSPAFHVVVHNMETAIPSAAILRQLATTVAPVPVKHCLCQGTSLAFFNFNFVETKTQENAESKTQEK